MAKPSKLAHVVYMIFTSAYSSLDFKIVFLDA